MTFLLYISLNAHYILRNAYYRLFLPDIEYISLIGHYFFLHFYCRYLSQSEKMLQNFPRGNSPFYIQITLRSSLLKTLKHISESNKNRRKESANIKQPSVFITTVPFYQLDSQIYPVIKSIKMINQRFSQFNYNYANLKVFW